MQHSGTKASDCKEHSMGVPRETYMSLPQVANTWSLDQRVHLTAPACCCGCTLRATMVPSGHKPETTRLQSLEAVAILPALHCIDQIPPAGTLLLSTLHYTITFFLTFQDEDHCTKRQHHCDIKQLQAGSCLVHAVEVWSLEAALFWWGSCRRCYASPRLP